MAGSLDHSNEYMGSIHSRELLD